MKSFCPIQDRMFCDAMDISKYASNPYSREHSVGEIQRERETDRQICSGSTVMPALLLAYGRVEISEAGKHCSFSLLTLTSGGESTTPTSFWEDPWCNTVVKS